MRKDTPLISLSRKKIAVFGSAVVIGLAGWNLLTPDSPLDPPPADGVGGPDESMFLASVYEPALAGWGPSGLTNHETALCGVTIADSSPDSVAPTTEIPFSIACNQSFYEALQTRDVPHVDIIDLVKACKPYRNLSRVKEGDVFRLAQRPDGRIRTISFDLDDESYLTFVRVEDDFQVQELTYPVEHRLAAVSGTIEASLYASLQQADAPLSLAPKLNDILGWEIDFNRDLRQGDSFRILYEEIYRDGRNIRTGSILAVEFVNRSDAHRAFRFVNPEGHPGYYDLEGRNLQKQLLRAPLEYSRISSGFSWRRFHPVLKKYMPHMGVDYAAPVGTPVRAAGAGSVVAATTKKGNGRYVQIRHNNRAYESYYLHLSSFGSGIKTGAKVVQGQIIGYVGATGYTTGPHLDFRIKKNGQFVDPRRVKLPPADPVADSSRAAFDVLASLYNRTLGNLLPQSPAHAVTVAVTAEPPAQNGTSTADPAAAANAQ
ncbi:MAG: peptidoglycan DD-metalloendopeptidase family protein [bacterium]